MGAFRRVSSPHRSSADTQGNMVLGEVCETSSIRFIRLISFGAERGPLPHNVLAPTHSCMILEIRPTGWELI